MKHIINPGILIILFFFVSCTKEQTINTLSSDNQTNQNSTERKAPHYIGERFGGGIIFALNSSKTRGLIADTVDFPTCAWWNGTYLATGATGKAIGTGIANTRKIVSAQGVSGNYAAIYCSKSKRSGYTDWFLPSKDELNELYKQKNVVGGFADFTYWSSSENGNFLAETQDFSFGFQGTNPKDFVYYVRAIRIF